MKKKWIYKTVPSNEKVEEFSKVINVNTFLSTLILQRNISTYEQAKDFFRPSLDLLHDPFLMKDMDVAVDRIKKAINNCEKILIYGDYDVDGTTSVALVYGYLKGQCSSIDFYIPDRYKEGYGISAKGIEWAAENGIQLVITLDCGIKSVELIEKARSLGIDFIVCDHHQPGSILPPAVAVLDPKRSDCSYPYKELSGCGVGFKLMQALTLSQCVAPDELFSYLDLVAISIASDIVHITGENRVLTYFGMNCINTSCRPGLKALIEVAGLKKQLSITDIVFGIGPRINAAGRIAHAGVAVLLMLTKTEEEAKIYAEQLNCKNILRRDFDANITTEALAMIHKESIYESKSTVLFKEDWHKGVIGIVASRCIEKYYKPTIILTESNEMATGSARSVDGFDVYEAISKCAGLLEHYGGHKYAAGLTLKKENIQAFKTMFENAVAEVITEEQLLPRIYIDLTLPLNSITNRFYNIIKQMSPFGPENMQPVFASFNVYDDGRAKVLKDTHLKLYVKQDNGSAIEAIGFGMAERYAEICDKQRFNLCYTISENEFNGEKSLQLVIKDLEIIN